MNHADQIKAYLRGAQAEMIALLERLVLMESPTDQANTQGPVLDLLQNHLEKLEYRCTRLPGKRFGGHFYARPYERITHSKRRWQLLLGHCDTVWPLGTLDSMPLVREGDVLRGPGIYDMKAGLVEIVFALQALRELQLTPEVEPVVFINSDEELGSRESSRYIRALARGADRALVMEPSLGFDGKLKTTRKGVGRFEICIKGKAAHAGLDPGAGASAILELSHVIQKVFALNDVDRGTSVNVGVIDGGVRANVVAPESRAIVDVRISSQAEAERVERAMLGLCTETPGVSLEVSGGIGRPPMEATAANRQFWQVASGLAQELSLDIGEGMAGGGSDGNTTSQYTATLDGLGAVGDGAHAAHEHIQVAQLCERTALLGMLILVPPLAQTATPGTKKPHNT